MITDIKWKKDDVLGPIAEVSYSATWGQSQQEFLEQMQAEVNKYPSGAVCEVDGHKATIFASLRLMCPERPHFSVYESERGDLICYQTFQSESDAIDAIEELSAQFHSYVFTTEQVEGRYLVKGRRKADGPRRPTSRPRSQLKLKLDTNVDEFENILEEARKALQAVKDFKLNVTVDIE